MLARDQRATAAQPIDRRVLLRRLASRYAGCYTFTCAGSGPAAELGEAQPKFRPMQYALEG